MLKTLTSFLLVLSLLSITSAPPIIAQPQERPQQDAVVIEKTETNSADLKRTIDREDAKFRAESSKFDPVKAEKEARKQTTKSGWTKKEKLAVVLIGVAIAAIIFVVVKYGKDCIRSSPPGCTPGVDDNCTCLEYAQNL